MPFAGLAHRNYCNRFGALLCKRTKVSQPREYYLPLDPLSLLLRSVQRFTG